MSMEQAAIVRMAVIGKFAEFHIILKMKTLIF